MPRSFTIVDLTWKVSKCVSPPHAWDPLDLSLHYPAQAVLLMLMARYRACTDIVHDLVLLVFLLVTFISRPYSFSIQFIDGSHYSSLRLSFEPKLEGGTQLSTKLVH